MLSAGVSDVLRSEETDCHIIGDSITVHSSDGSKLKNCFELRRYDSLALYLPESTAPDSLSTCYMEVLVEMRTARGR